MKKLYILLAFFLIVPGLNTTSLFAQQTDSTDTSAEDEIESAVEVIDPESGESVEELAEFLQYLAQNPVNINRADVEELLSIPAMNLRTANAILAYRKEKPFEEISELTDVRGIGAKTYERIAPFVTVGSGAELAGDLFLSRAYWMQNQKVEFISRYQQVIETQEGFRDGGTYLGNPIKLYQRLNYSSRHLSANLTQDHDPGEPFEGTLGYDFNSFHVAVQDVGPVGQLIVGDFAVNVGQGLVLWNGGSFGKGRNVIDGVDKSERGIRPYRSAVEARFQRGVALQMGDDFETSVFYSSRSVSASQLDSLSIRFPTQSGLYRTETERERRYNVDQMFTGGRFRYRFTNGWIGATAYYTKFSQPIGTTGAVYQTFDFTGDEAAVGGIDMHYYWDSASIFGEFGRSKNGGMGWIQGVKWEIDEQNELSAVYRWYEKDFQSVYGSGFGETSSNPQNEQGFYLGYKVIPNERLTIQTYIDSYNFPTPRFRLDQPGRGFDWLMSNEFEFNEVTDFSLLLRFEKQTAEQDFDLPNGVADVRSGEEARANVRFDISHTINRKVRLRNRVETVRYTAFGEEEYGWLIYQDLRWIPTSKIRIDMRYTLFDTESFDSRIYQYENDLLYTFSNPVLNGEGQRTYVLVKYSPFEFMDIWLKWGTFIYENVFTVGSGNDEVRGNSRNRIGAQVRLSF